jgi:hypothetical protein
VDCQRTAELLPWYLNGTLDAAERGELERHLAGCDGCRTERRQVERALLLFGSHPPVGMLLDFVDGRPEVPRDLVEAHLAGCAACTAELAMVRESRAALQSVEAPDRRARVVPLRRPAAPPRLWRATAAVAAVIALAGVGSGLWAWWALDRQEEGFARRQREAEVRSLGGARLNVPIHDLWPEGAVPRSAAGGPVRLSAEDGPAATLILNSLLAAAERVKRLELRDAQGQVLQSLSGVSVGPSGSVTLSLPLAGLPRGILRILLFAPDGSEPLESYAFELY